MATDSSTPGVRKPLRGRVGSRAFRSTTLGFTLLMASLSLACATGSSGMSSGDSGSRSDVMTREQLASIEQTEDISLYDAIWRMHPPWLQGRGTSTSVVVYFNGARLGDTGDLRRFRVSDVQYVEHTAGYGSDLIVVFGRAGT